MIRSLVALFLTAIAGTLLLEAGNRRKLWELNLSELIGKEQAPGFQPEPVWSMSFSPDEAKLAIGFGEHLDPASPSFIAKGHLIIISVDHPKTAVHRFEVNTSLPLIRGDFIAWSPSGTSVVVNNSNPLILHLTGGPPCTFPKDFQFGGFLSGDRAILYHRGGFKWRDKPGTPEKTEIRVYRPDCSVADSWQVGEAAVVMDTCPASDLIALESYPGTIPTRRGGRVDVDITIALYPAQSVKQRWTRDILSVSAGERFARQCQEFCTGAKAAGHTENDVVCLDIEKGSKISENTGVTLSGGMAPGGIVGSGGELLLLNDYKITSHEGGFWQFFDLQSSWARLKRRVLWNISTGRDVLSWGPRSQKIEDYPPKDHKTESLPFAVSLSPAGKYLAEGGSGVCQLYEINQTGN